jgi:hypothetical protein
VRRVMKTLEEHSEEEYDFIELNGMKLSEPKKA